MVQTRWSYVNRNYSSLTEVEAILLDGHFAIEHSSRYRSGVFFNFNGTAGIWRRVAIDDAGGWQHDTLTEDTDLSYRAQMRGWKFIYLPEIDCPSVSVSCCQPPASSMATRRQIPAVPLKLKNTPLR